MADDNQSKNPSLKAQKKSHYLRRQDKVPKGDKQSKEPSKASQRDALRRHKALEREFDRRSRGSCSGGTALPSPTLPTSAYPLLPPEPPSLTRRSPSQGQPTPGPSTRRAPEATFTPTAAGLRHEDPSTSEIPANIRAWMESAIRQSIAESLQHMTRSGFSPRASEHGSLPIRSPPQPASPVEQVHSQRDSPPAGPQVEEEGDFGDYGDFGEEEEFSRPGSSRYSEPPLEADLLEGEMSEDEGTLPDQPVIGGLFKPHMFKSLLFKAKNVSGLLTQPPSGPSTSLESPEDSIFSQPIIEAEVIPTPPIFLDLVSRQLSSTGVPPTPSSQDKKIFNLDSAMCDLLDIPAVGDPIVALASSSIPSEALEALKPEDKRSELALRRAHLSDAWAIRSATAASFFTRSSIRWLRQLRDHVPISNVRAHQHIAKLVAAAEFSADATYQSVKFSSRAITSHVTARRLLWLKNWQADVKHKVKLASAPIKGDKLFGPALEPLLVEGRSKKKYLPSLLRRSDSRGQQPFRRSFPRPFYQPYFPPRYPRPPSFRSQDRPDSGDRGRRGSGYKRPFRGSGGRPYRRPR